MPSPMKPFTSSLLHFFFVGIVGADVYASSPISDRGPCARDFARLISEPHKLPTVPTGVSIEQVGNHYHLRGSRLKGYNTLSSAILKNPTYFKKFEIEFLDDKTLVLPTTKRLKTLIDRLRKAKDPSAPNINFAESLGEDADSDVDYLANLSKKRRPFFPISRNGVLEETDTLFLHDWTAHWLGMATIPKSLAQEIRLTSALFREILENPVVAKNPDLIENLKYNWVHDIVDKIDLGTGMVASGLKTNTRSSVLNGVIEIRNAGISRVMDKYFSDDNPIKELLQSMTEAEKNEINRIVQKFKVEKSVAEPNESSLDVDQIFKMYAN